MNFSSIPPYLDPSNWQQQVVTHHVGSSSSSAGGASSGHLPPPPLPQPPPPPPPLPHGVGGTGSIRPGSMAERARMANIPMPEAALKCPRCESTNTKFCYFNNYSLTQPRHFCKTCRRYWTRGGALRNVPVGGGCRRNKRSKGSSSKSPVSSDRQQTSGSGNSSSSAIASHNSGGGLSPQIPPLRFMSPLHHHHQLTDFDIAGFSYGAALSAPAAGDLNFQMSNANLGGSGSSTVGSLLGLDQWRVQQQPPPQFPFLSGLDPFDGGGGDGSGWQMRQKLPSNSRNLTQIGNSVKMEETPEVNNIVGRQFLGNDQYWSSGSMPWSDLSGFSSSSSTRNNNNNNPL